MLNTLRRRFILSHVVPLLVIVPLMGIALIYVAETQVLLPSLSRELEGEAALLAELAGDQPMIWSDPALAQALVDRVRLRLDARLMLVSVDGRLWSSSDPADAGRLGQRIDDTGLDTALAGRASVQVDYSQRLQTEIVDVFVPVAGSARPVVGVIRLSYNLTHVDEEFLLVRYLIASVLAIGTVLGAAAGWVLALNLARPLRQVAQAVSQLAQGERLTPLAQPGPEEINLLVRAFNILTERLHSLEKARRHLLANLVHELGRPLGAVRSAVQALQGGAASDTTLRQQLLVGIEEELQRLQRLLDDLAHLHDQVLGTLELDRRSVALSEWLPHVLIPWREAAQSKGLRWQASVAADLPVVQIDPDRLAQALGNLLSNAVKYTPLGGTVSVEAEVVGDTLQIRVSDTGPGIVPEEQAHVFEPFYRGQMLRRFPQGMGLGLTIARDLITAHGGQLELDSAPGLGSRFTIRIPCH